ncbi:MAG: TetR/AcrR family transcriptional regulator [Gammaproteobacteria bacterium]|nr:TetR/AcrR family transcriptional regulator [Gammaproteobacteria bacterium]
MAQKSKKDYITATALPLFLENGFKGTSIDMVVRASKVSKPTVYNHFPDKTALLLAVLSRWIDANKPLISPLKDSAELDDFVRRHWLTDEAVQFYALVIGEGWRFPQAKRLFWDQFDHLWRKALGYVSANIDGLDLVSMEQWLDHQLLSRLKLL